MQEQNDLNPADREFEAALRNLSPAAGKVDAISAAFAAGKRSAHRQTRHIAMVSVPVIVLVSALGYWTGRHNGYTRGLANVTPAKFYVVDPGVSHIRERGYESVVSAASNVAPISKQSIAVLEQTVLEHGIDALPVTRIRTQKAVHPDEL